MAGKVEVLLASGLPILQVRRWLRKEGVVPQMGNRNLFSMEVAGTGTGMLLTVYGLAFRAIHD